MRVDAPSLIYKQTPTNPYIIISHIQRCCFLVGRSDCSWYCYALVLFDSDVTGSLGSFNNSKIRISSSPHVFYIVESNRRCFRRARCPPALVVATPNLCCASSTAVDASMSSSVPLDGNTNSNESVMHFNAAASSAEIAGSPIGFSLGVTASFLQTIVKASKCVLALANSKFATLDKLVIAHTLYDAFNSFSDALTCLWSLGLVLEYQRPATPMP